MSLIISVSSASALSTAFAIILLTASSDNVSNFSSKFSCFARSLNTSNDKFESVSILSIFSNTSLAVS